MGRMVCVDAWCAWLEDILHYTHICEKRGGGGEGRGGQENTGKGTQ